MPITSNVYYPALRSQSQTAPPHTVKISKVLYTKYFKPNQTAKEVQEIVEKVLDMYFANK